jgi:dTDP-4-dehydrorhamnose 3,5-epimerase-like enzyme
MNDIFAFEVFSDDRGSLVSWEANKNIPFEIKRVYCIYGVKGYKRRGMHAHKTGEIMLVCIKGTCRVLLNDGVNSTETLLDEATKGLYVPCERWLEMYDFSDDAVLLALASNRYDEEDYIRDFNAFLAGIGQKD